MKSISKILMVITVLLSSTNGFAKIKLTNEVAQNASHLTTIFDNYFSIKDALISSDADATATKAKDMATAIKVVDMNKLSTEEHNVWMKVAKDLTNSVEAISKAKDVSKQREVFSLLSKNMYDLIIVSKLAEPVYYQNCPMFNKGKGANWLSKESAIKNPYYGNKMLTCGSVVETIK